MVTELYVLLSVQNLQQRRGGISLVITADLIDFIQKHQRVGNACLTQSIYKTARHSPHIGFSVSANFRFVMDASQTDPNIPFIQGAGYGTGNGCLTGSRRAHKANNRAVAFFGKDTHSQIFENALFHLLQAVVILF